MSAHQKAHAASQPAKAEKAKKTAKTAPKPVNAAQMLEAPETLRTEDVLAAQQQVGNQVVQRALDKGARRKPVTDDQGHLTPELAGKIKAKRGGGSPLPDDVQMDVAKKFKRNFSNVRLHTDETADSLSRTINARAFTIGNDIFFKKGVFAPETSAGRETLIHELTHVVQQGGKGGGGKLKLGAPDTAQEKEADRIGKKHATAVSAAPTGAVQRAAEEEELQMQAEEDELQMQAEEDELQMQAEEDELQMQAEEDELQMQSEEEEALQAQPDTGGVVQRTLQDELQKKILERKQLGGRKVQNEAFEKFEKKNTENTLNKGTLTDAKVFSMSAKSKEAALGAKRSEMGIGSEKNLKHLAKLDQKQDESFKGRIGKQLKEEQQGRSDSHRNKLMETVRNPKSSPEEAKAAQEKLDSIFKLSKKEKLKKAFSKEGIKSMWRRKSLSLDPSKEAKFDRKKNLKKAARSGDEDAYQKLTQMKDEKKKAEEAKKNEPSPVKDFLKDKVGGFLKKKLLGGDKDDKDEKGGGVTVNLNGVPMGAGGGGGTTAPAGGGGGDSSIVAVMQQYAQVVEENKKLKEELANAKKTT